MVRIDQDKILFSKKLRASQTPWEVTLWSHLRAKKNGVKFKRQVVLGQYIFDFGAKKHRLMIELDGFQHKGNGRIKDKEKLEYAKRRGFKVIKFWNRDIEKNLPEVLNKIEQELNN